MTAATITVYLTIFLFGLCFGSFMNVCILRIPEGESIVNVPSHCCSCGRRLKWYELIPLFSYLALRGRCSGCKSHISVQYPFVELANGLMCVIVLSIKGLSLDMALCQLFISALTVIAFIDARTGEIPLGTVIFTAVLGTFRLIFVNRSQWLDILLGAVIMGGLFLLILLISGGRAMGGGDVKLVAACGLFLGLKLCALGFVLSCFIGSIIHLFRMKFMGAGRQLAFGPYLAAGFGISALFGSTILGWYLSFFN